MDRIKLLLGLGIATFAAGCTEDVNSTDIKTSGMQAHFKALESKAGEGTKVTADLRVNGGDSSNDYIDTKGEDTLSAEAGDETVTLDKFEVGLGDGVMYEATLSEEAEDAQFTFSFNRGPDDDDAPNSFVTLPPAFELEGLETNGEVSRSSSLNLTWEGSSSDTVRYHVEGDCLFTTIEREAGKNVGSVTIPPGDMDATSSKETETCGAKLYVELVRKGTLDPAFGDGSVEGIRRRWISFVSVP